MAQGPAGSLYIDIITNIAKLQTDMNAMKRAVGDATGVVSASLDRARSSTERYLASLEAEAARLGKTSSEIKKMEIAANAAAAEAQGFDELAQKIRKAGAAIEQAKADAAALAAEQVRLAKEAREAAAAEERFASELAAVRASVDPLGASIRRLEGQIETNSAALAKGAIEEAEYARNAQVLENRLEGLKREQVAAAAAMNNMGKSAGLSRAHMLNLGYQVNDLVVSLASGQKPMMVFLQQGAQIGQIGAQAGVGLGGMAKQMGMVAINFAKAHPLMIAGAAAAGAAAYGFHLLGEEMGKNAHLDAYAKKLGLTTEEIKRAGGATVTFGDMVKGVWTTIVDEAALDKKLKNVNKMFLDFFKDILNQAVMAGVEIYAELAAAYDTVVQVWKQFPQMMSDAFTKAVNWAIEKLESLVNASIGGLNKLIDGTNALFGTKVDHLADAHFGRVTNAAGKAGDAAAISYTANYNKRRAQGIKEAERLENSLYAHIIKAAEDRLKAADKPDKKKKPSDALQKDLDALEANIKAQWALAAAYDAGDAAAMRAEAAVKAHEKAIRKEGDYATYYALELRKMVADQAVASAKQANDLRVEADAQETVNAAIKDGSIAYAQAADFLKKQAQARQLEAAMANASGEEYDKLGKELANLEGQYNRATRAKTNFQALGAIDKNNDEIERLKTELTLIGKTNEERERTLAILAVEQQYRGTGISEDNLATLKRQAAERVTLQHQVTQGTDLYNQSLHEQLDLLETLDRRAHILADTLADGFGRAGEALGQLLTNFTGFAAERERLQNKLDAQIKEAGANEKAAAVARAEFERDSATAEQQHLATTLAATKDLFGRKSAMYKTLTRLEQVYGALQLANNAKAIASDLVLTAKSIANALARGAADAAAGAAKLFAQLGVGGFVAVAAMVAVLASMGLKGIRGGSSGTRMPTAEETQAHQGTGSVLGSPDAKSDSIAKSLALVEAHTNKDLEYSSEMVRSLRAIETNIGGLAGLIARQIGASGSFDTSGLGLGTKTGLGLGANAALGGLGALAGLMTFAGPIGLAGALIVPVIQKIPVIGDIIGGLLNTLFGTKKTVELMDQGFQFTAQSVQQIIDSGVIGQIYQDLETTKKSKFFGLSLGKKTSYSTQTSPLDGGFTDQIALLIGSLRDGVVSAAKVIGVEGAEAMVDAFQINLGRISLKDMSADEIKDALNAVFSKAADDMAGSVIAGLDQFQKVGEGLFETLTRLARDYQVVDVTLESIGKTFGAIGVASVGARENLIDLFGGLDNFTDLTGQFAEAFLTEAERMAPVQAAVTKAMADLGLAGIDTKSEFKDVVLGLDLTTEAGQEMYAQLLAIAPAFAKVQDYLSKLNPELEDTAKTAEQLAAIEKQRRSMEIQLLDLTGHSAEALAMKRADEIAALDETLRPLQEQIFAAQDAADAAKALADAQAEAVRVADEAAKAAEAIANEHRSLEIRLAEALGDAAGALAMKRADELAAMNEQNRALAEAVFAAEDAAAAQETLNSVHMTAAELAKTQRDLEIRLMEAQGDAAGALAARRADELAAMDETLRPLLLLVFAAEDAASATEALGKVTQTAAEIAKTRHDLELRLMEVQGRDADLLAARRADEMAATDDSLKGMLAQIFAAEDAKAAAEALAQAQADEARAAEEAAQQAAELAKTHRDLEIRLMEAQGDAAGALAARRADELAAADDVGKALLNLIFAAEDAAAAGEALNKVTQTTAEIAKTRRDLEIQLLDATGHSVEALAARRADELAVLDASLRPLQETVWAALDAADAQKALADAQQQAADAARAIADKRGDLEIQLLRAQGNEMAAVALERQRELEALDPSLRAMQMMVYSAQDATAAQQALADAQAESARAAEDAARAAQELADKRSDLEIRLLRATGHEVEAVAMERARELAALDESLRPLLESVYAAEDAKAAMDAQNQSASDLAGKYRDLGISLREFRASLAGAAALTTEQAFRAAAAKFGGLAGKARLGDVDALGNLASAGQDFLSAAKENASSALEYQRNVAFVAGAVDAAIKAADAGMTDAEKQLSVAQQQVDLLTTLNGTTMSVHDAIVQAAANAAPTVPSSAYVSEAAPDTADFDALLAEVKMLRAEIVAPTKAIALGVKSLDDRTEAWDDAGFVRISTDGTPIEVTVEGEVEVTNPTVEGVATPLVTQAAP